jgi:murein DD-endopeptidase MepM/ murein hydrolase activator NlpD
MDEQLHIIIAGDKGKVFKVPCSKKKLCIFVTASVLSLLILTVTSICSFSLYARNVDISSQLEGLKEKLHTSAEQIAVYSRLTEEQRLKLDLKVARLELNNIKQATAFEEEKESIMSTAVDELNERSQLIERIIGSIGIKVPVNKGNENDSKHSGGLFIQQPVTDRDELLFKADKYLNAIRYLPFGKPVKGAITSRFGKRQDPLNNKSAYHTGIDFRGKRGEPVYATADGVVKKSFRNGGYGNFVVIDHGNGYTTAFAHLQKYVVHKGDRVERGQLIGLIGNTGRSTGPHLHYEVALDNKPINPYSFLKIAGLSGDSSSSPVKK